MAMTRCDRCGNDYDKAFSVTLAGRTHTFDSFECAIATLAPECAHCRCRIIGHGVEARGHYYCCAHCAKESGVVGLRDRQDAQAAAQRDGPPAPPEELAHVFVASNADPSCLTGTILQAMGGETAAADAFNHAA